MTRPRRRKNTRRPGVVILEFIIAAPIVFIAMLAIFQFGFLALTLQVGHAALIEGARRGAELHPPSKPVDRAGFDNDISDSIVEKMNRYLNVHCMEIFDPTQNFADNPDFANVQILIERSGVTVSRGAAVNFPAGFACMPIGPTPSPDEIRITLSFPLVDPTDPSGCGNPVPDWLRIYGFTLEDCVFEVSSRMPLE